MPLGLAQQSRSINPATAYDLCIFCSAFVSIIFIHGSWSSSRGSGLAVGEPVSALCLHAGYGTAWVTKYGWIRFIRFIRFLAKHAKPQRFAKSDANAILRRYKYKFESSTALPRYSRLPSKGYEGDACMHKRHLRKLNRSSFWRNPPSQKVIPTQFAKSFSTIRSHLSSSQRKGIVGCEVDTCTQGTPILHYPS